MAKIAILTCFNETHPGYSLTQVVANIGKMFYKFGHKVDLLVNETFKDAYPAIEGVNIVKCIPTTAQIDYRNSRDLTEEHKTFSKVLAERLKSVLPQYDMIITQDWIFCGWFYPYYLALEAVVEETKHCKFIHYINSVPNRQDTPGAFDWYNIKRLNENGNHKIVSLTAHNKPLIVKKYDANDNDVVVIPYITDIRIEGDFCRETWELIDYMPNILQGDVVCIYPASTDRLRAKQIQVLIMLFDGFKRRNMRCALVCANQWATGRVPKENIEKYKKLATELGLNYGEEFLFTSDFNSPKYDTGISRKMLADLRKCGNLFIFPSIEEAYGLVGLEAALDGQYLVINKDVGCFKEIYEDCVHYEEFGSMEHCAFYGKSNEEMAIYIDNMSRRILEGMAVDKTCMVKTRIRCFNNMDYQYNNVWAPLLEE